MELLLQIITEPSSELGGRLLNNYEVIMMITVVIKTNITINYHTYYHIIWNYI